MAKHTHISITYIPEKWKYTEDTAHLGRIEFTGVEDKHSEYIGKNAKNIFGKYPGPTFYFNM